MPDKFIDRGASLFKYALVGTGGVVLLNTFALIAVECNSENPNIMYGNPIGPGLEDRYYERFLSENTNSLLELTLPSGTNAPDYGKLTYLFKPGFLLHPYTSVKTVGGLRIAAAFERRFDQTDALIRVYSRFQQYPLSIRTAFQTVEADMPNVLALEWGNWAITRQLVDGVETPRPEALDLKRIFSFNVRGY